MPTDKDYDDVPYRDCPLSQTRPDYIGLIGKLFGINAAPPNSCRVLELGCAGGGNLIPLAYYWPESSFLGVELSEKQAAKGQQLIDDLQLSNIKILQEDISQLDENLGTFDYIIAHGVYSWVPATVQQHILQLIAKTLAPNGIAFVSYNTFPGWHFRMAMRDMMLYPDSPDISAEQRRDNGIKMLTKLAKGLADNASLSEQWLKKEAENLLNLPTSYLLHDYLEANNKPEYFYQFMHKAQTHGLQFLSEADLYTMLGSTLTELAEKDLEDIDDLIEYQQQLDFYYVKHFRQSLLCHENIEVDYELDLETTKDYFFIALLNSNEEVEFHSDRTQTFTHPNGETFDISHPLTKAAIVVLSDQYPESYSYTELLKRAQQLLNQYNSNYSTDDPDNMLIELFNLFISQGIDLSQINRKTSVGNGDKPKATRLAQVYAAHGRCCIGNTHHSNIPLNDLDRQLIKLLDGDTNKEQILRHLVERVSSNKELQQTLGLKHNQTDEQRNLLTNYINQSLKFFALNGLLEV